MAMNQRYDKFQHIRVTAPVDVESGDPVRVGAVAGVAQFDAEAGQPVTIWLNGSYAIPVTGTPDEGQAVYITEDGELTTTDEGAWPWGVAVSAVEFAPFGADPSVAVQVPVPDPEP